MTSLGVAPAVAAIFHGLAIGVLIGTERGWASRAQQDGSRVAGLRTFGLLGLAGGALSQLPVALAAALGLGLAGVVAVGYHRQQDDQLSATSAVTALITLALGAIAGSGRPVAGLAGAAAVMTILASRRQLHAWVSAISEAEIAAIARFAVIALVILPLLPDAAYGPYGALNPRDLWMVVVIVSGLSFAGYVATKRLGPGKGLLLTAASGALVSSTAVTVALARRLGPDAPNRQLSAGIAVASGVLFVRILVLIGILAPQALAPAAMIAAPGLLVTLPFLARAFGRRSIKVETGFALGNPLEIGPALLLAGLIAGLAVLSRWLIDLIGPGSAAVLVTLVGLVDADAAVVTFSRLPAGTLPGEIASVCVVAPIILNTYLKAALTITLGARPYGWRCAVPLLLAGSASAAASAAMLML